MSSCNAGHDSRPVGVQARSVCPSDPLVANELGVLAFRNRQLDAAIHHFTIALELLPPKAAAGELAARPSIVSTMTPS